LAVAVDMTGTGRAKEKIRSRSMGGGVKYESNSIQFNSIQFNSIHAVIGII